MSINGKAAGVLAAPATAQEISKHRHSASAPHAGQALRVIEGETKAAQYLARLHAQQAGPDELAVTVSMLYGVELRGFCRTIEKALGTRDGERP